MRGNKVVNTIVLSLLALLFLGHSPFFESKVICYADFEKVPKSYSKGYYSLNS